MRAQHCEMHKCGCAEQKSDIYACISDRKAVEVLKGMYVCLMCDVWVGVGVCMCVHICTYFECLFCPYIGSDFLNPGHQLKARDLILTETFEVILSQEISCEVAFPVIHRMPERVAELLLSVLPKVNLECSKPLFLLGFFIYCSYTWKLKCYNILVFIFVMLVFTSALY